jgi:hypothetical protein
MQEEKKFIQATEIKELKSDTKASAVHVKWSKKHYHVVKAFHGRIGWMISGFHATNRGMPIIAQQIFTYMGDDLQSGVDHLLNILNGIEEPKKQNFYR